MSTPDSLTRRTCHHYRTERFRQGHRSQGAGRSGLLRGGQSAHRAASEVRRAGQGFGQCAPRGAGDRHPRRPEPEAVSRIFQTLAPRACGPRCCISKPTNATLMRRFSETRRPHPLGIESTVLKSIRTEREQLAPIRKVADHIINTSKFNVHELREVIEEKFRDGREQSPDSHRHHQLWLPPRRAARQRPGLRCALPSESQLHSGIQEAHRPASPEWRATSGRSRRPSEFIDRISELLVYLIPHYIREGKSYLTIAFGCTGGTSPVGHDRERDSQAAGAGRIQGERDAPRHWTVIDDAAHDPHRAIAVAAGGPGGCRRATSALDRSASALLSLGRRCHLARSGG